MIVLEINDNHLVTTTLKINLCLEQLIERMLNDYKTSSQRPQCNIFPKTPSVGDC